jgi:hypothetical protein
VARIEFALRQHLAADTAVAARVSGRIYPLVIPQDADPNGDKLTYRRESGPREHNLTGGIDWATAMFEIVAFSKSYDNAKLLVDDVRNALQGFCQDTFGTGGNQVTVGFVQMADEEDGYYEPADSSDAGWFAIVCKFKIKYFELAPSL